jgi:hypothetical protein
MDIRLSLNGDATRRPRSQSTAGNDSRQAFHACGSLRELCPRDHCEAGDAIAAVGNPIDIRVAERSS